MILEKFSLAGKVAIVTGGGTGIGQAISLVLAEAGADIVLAARRLEPLEKTAEMVKKLGRQTMCVPTDVTVSSQVDSMVKKAVERFGRIDILINNAGAGIQYLNLNILDLKDEEWHGGLDIDLTGAYYCSRAAAREMIKSGGGKIVSMSSAAAMVGMASAVVYGIAKAGVMQLTRTLAINLAPHRITVNCIVAGPFRTRMIMGDQKDDETAMKRGRYIPVGHIGRPEDMGALALLLTSPASDYITGQLFIIDGGLTVGRYAPIGYVLPEREMERP